MSLSALTQINSDKVALESDDTGSLLDVSALTDLSVDSGSVGHWLLQAAYGGTVDLSNGLTSLAGVDLSTDGNMSLSQLTSYTGGNLTVNGGTYTLGALTDLDNSNVAVENGASLSLPALAGYTAGAWNHKSGKSGKSGDTILVVDVLGMFC